MVYLGAEFGILSLILQFSQSNYIYIHSCSQFAIYIHIYTYIGLGRLSETPVQEASAIEQ